MRLIAFDVYGTVVDPMGVVDRLGKRFGAQASAAAQLWRDKNLEYSFRRALMCKYADFDACTAQALHFVSRQLGVKLDESEVRALLDSYVRLPLFPDVKSSLETLKGRVNQTVGDDFSLPVASGRLKNLVNRLEWPCD